jgi:threonine dehydrogenase-like Zn-dependent dehydrogenase
MAKLVGHRAVLVAPRDLRYESVSADTDKLGGNQLCAVTEYTAISIGTEKAAYIGLPALRPGVTYPRFVGYCNAARVVAIGADVHGVAIGDRIITHQPHQSIFICEQSDVLALIPDTLDARTASLTYLAHVGLTALHRTGLQVGEVVAVQGLGPIGLATVALASALGARRVIAIGNNESRLACAMKVGATNAILSTATDIEAQVASIASGSLPDIVVTTVNDWEAWRTTLQLVRLFGRIAVLGFPGRGVPLQTFNPLDSSIFYTRQPTIVSAGLASGPEQWGAGDARASLKANMRFLLDLVAQGKLALGELITHEVSWSDLASVYELAESGDKSLIGAVVRWDGAA